MRSVIILTGLLLVLPGSSPVHAGDSLELGFGKASHGIDALRLAWQRDWQQRWLASDTGELSGRHALSVNRWSNEAEAIDAIGYSPVLIYRWQNAPIDYLRFGIGVAYLSQTRIKGRQLSSHFQFEDQLGIGWQWPAYELGLSYLHYSNAGIEKPNHGIDMLLLSLTLSLE